MSELNINMQDIRNQMKSKKSSFDQQIKEGAKRLWKAIEAYLKTALEDETIRCESKITVRLWRNSNSKELWEMVDKGEFDYLYINCYRGAVEFSDRDDEGREYAEHNKLNIKTGKVETVKVSSIDMLRSKLKNEDGYHVQEQIRECAEPWNSAIFTELSFVMDLN